MADPLTCSVCGTALVDGECPRCGRQWHFRFIHREVVILGVLCALAVVAFLATHRAAASNHALFLRDAEVLYDVGRRALEAGRPEAAIDSLRRASRINEENRQYRLALAEALEGSGRDVAARQELLALRALSPEDPEINVELARLEARVGNLDSSVHYYQNALYGYWPDEEMEARRQLRVELIRYLLEESQQSSALSEVLALAANLPHTIEWRIRVANLFMAVGEPGRALQWFELSLEDDPDNGAALAGAGIATFQLDDFARARRYLRAAPDDTPQVKELRAVTDSVLTRDPLAARLWSEERRRRLSANVERARERLESCPAEQRRGKRLTALRDELAAFESTLEPASGERLSEAIQTGVQLVHRVQVATSGVCGAPTALDRALTIIGRLHRSDPS